jgi:hypothetical protein
MTNDETYIASFVPDAGAWAGAIYAVRDGLGPELVLRCSHRHDSMWPAMDCAAKELKFATRVVGLAERFRDVAS